MDQQTKAALKRDQFVTTTTHGLEWASENRRSVLVTSALVLAVILVVVIGAVVYSNRESAASAGFGDAMQAYQTPLAVPGQPVPPGTKTYPNEVERAKAANAMFLQIAHKYGMTSAGKNALYFAGLTYEEAGEKQQAADAFKKLSGSWDHNLAALAKLSLADLDRTTGQTQEAIDLYNQLAAHPTTTVPAGLAKLQLADLYTAQGKTNEAREIYAKLKDTDPKGVAGAVASEKLNPTPAPGAGPTAPPAPAPPPAAAAR